MTNRVRIDARLNPVEAPLPSALSEAISDFASGAYDDLPVRVVTSIEASLLIAKRINTVAFNSHLNQVLREYGLFVTLTDAEQAAVSYGHDAEMSDGLDRALELREWFGPAAVRTYRAPANLMDEFNSLVTGMPVSACRCVSA